MTPKLRVLVSTLAITIALDQGTKALVDAKIGFPGRVPVLEGFFYITHVRNPGAAFGLFAQGPEELRVAFFIAVSLLAALVILSFFRQLAPGDHTSALGLGLILGGAIGNLIDRVTRKEVIDFLHFRLWGGRSWPDFNLADVFIVVGVVILLIELLATEAESRAEDAETETDS
ncbi:MAG: signal peptidase II [Deltaproteobacteria bacterium]|nr:MAG: signal peptidase II [Deltaproteobacteria bacterium]